MFRTLPQNKRLHGLFGKLKIDEETKKDLVWQFTQERTEHTSEMYFNECQNLIGHLDFTLKGAKFSVDPIGVSEQKQRRKLFSIAREMRWTINGTVDRDRLYKWVEKYGHLNPKPLMKYTYRELPELVTQFQQVQKDFYAKR